MRVCLPLTMLGMGALFFLVDPDAEVGVVIANRPMTAEEQVEYRASPMAQRRRRPGTVEEHEERARKRRVLELERQIQVDERSRTVTFYAGEADE